MVGYMRGSAPACKRRPLPSYYGSDNAPALATDDGRVELG